MKPRLVLLAVCLLLVPASAPAALERSLDHVWTARAGLGDEAWAEVLRIENQRRTGRYPRILHALVFEFEGLLWFYTPTEGTQSLSLYVDRLDQERADLRPLLQAIERGFTRWEVLPQGPAPARATPLEQLPNGCFVACVSEWRRLRRERVAVAAALLLSFYEDAGAGSGGHTVLAYEVAGELQVYDPADGKTARRFSPRLLADPLALARAVGGDRVQRFRTLTLVTSGAPVLLAQAKQPERGKSAEVLGG
ncbi:hypothetical protein [Opitutus sp. ER46]|uniref:hypothetical protein n=1 Tax=Opitutus sp. ER46 TaxID=2161864 RepID=UPI000D309BD5|nr:hypothetical protein [Opitutus sp. ER46]